MSALLHKLRNVKECVFALSMELESLQFQAREELCDTDCCMIEDVATALDNAADTLAEVLGDDQHTGREATRQRSRLRYFAGYLRKRTSPSYKLHRRNLGQ